MHESPTDDYYKDAIGKEGQALKNALHEIIDDHTQLSYDQVWEALRETDEDPNNVNNVILLYSGESRSKTRNGGNVGDWNREHTWAKSHGNFGTSKGPGTDIHHLRPTDVQVNSSRGNLDFDNGGSPVKNCNECKRTTNSWEPPDRVKGDVARILFYMATRYEKGDKVDLELNEKLNNGSTHTTVNFQYCCNGMRKTQSMSLKRIATTSFKNGKAIVIRSSITQSGRILFGNKKFSLVDGGFIAFVW